MGGQTGCADPNFPTHRPLFPTVHLPLQTSPPLLPPTFSIHRYVRTQWNKQNTNETLTRTALLRPSLIKSSLQTLANTVRATKYILKNNVQWRALQEYIPVLPRVFVWYITYYTKMNVSLNLRMAVEWTNPWGLWYHEYPSHHSMLKELIIPVLEIILVGYRTDYHEKNTNWLWKVYNSMNSLHMIHQKLIT